MGVGDSEGKLWQSVWYVELKAQPVCDGVVSPSAQKGPGVCTLGVEDGSVRKTRRGVVECPTRAERGDEQGCELDDGDNDAFCHGAPFA